MRKSNRSEKPRMAFMGVRISWLMLARNSLFARLAASAELMAWRQALRMVWNSSMEKGHRLRLRLQALGCDEAHQALELSVQPAGVDQGQYARHREKEDAQGGIGGQGGDGREFPPGSVIATRTPMVRTAKMAKEARMALVTDRKDMPARLTGAF
jgi:hypothetical protein